MEAQTKEQLKVALLGYGYAGKTLHAPLISCVPGLWLTHVVSSDRAKVEKDWPEVTVLSASEEAFANPQIDLIVAATPNDTHFDLARRALSAGKHVVVDKPFTTTVVEASELVALAANSKRLLSVFQNRRWDADFLTVRRILSEGRLGEVMHFESRYDRYRPQVRQRWRERPGPGGGLWYDLGPHLVDQALQLFGPPEAIYADFESQRKGATAVDYFHVLLRYGRKRIILHGGSLVLAETPRFTVHGTSGSFVKYGLDAQEEALKRGETPGRSGWGHDPHDGTLFSMQDEALCSTSVPTILGNYLTYYKAIRDAVLKGTPNPVPAEDALAVITVLEVASKSAATGRELPFNSVPVGTS